ncbi:MAG: hypothetical protein DIU55_003765, partial [Bacillota bacterium]
DRLFNRLFRRRLGCTSEEAPPHLIVGVLEFQMGILVPPGQEPGVVNGKIPVLKDSLEPDFQFQWEYVMGVEVGAGVEA